LHQIAGDKLQYPSLVCFSIIYKVKILYYKAKKKPNINGKIIQFSVNHTGRLIAKLCSNHFGPFWVKGFVHITLDALENVTKGGEL
jgi:hypothetical protein